MFRRETSLTYGTVLPGLLILMLSLAGLIPTTGQADVTWYRMTFDTLRLVPQGFEDRGKRYWFRREGGGNPLKVGRDPVSGSKALILSTGPTPDGAVRDRAEVQIYSGITWNRDWFSALRLRIPPGPYRISDWHVLMQCAQAGTERPPPISVDLEPDGQIALIARSERDAHDTLWSGPLTRGRWVTLVLGFRMGENGRARIWIDGQRMVDRRLPLGWHTEGRPTCALKTGIYRGASAHPFELRLDDITLADSYSAALIRDRLERP